MDVLIHSTMNSPINYIIHLLITISTMLIN
jgi:hypothetical protein